MSQLPINNITRTSKNRVIYTIGHSNVSAEKLLERLRKYEIDRVIDIRSKPYSRWCPQFNRGALEYALAELDINYDWRGNNLGGLDINVDYEKTLQWVFDRAEYENIVLMCSEANHLKCHRFTVITPDLENLGGSVIHISYK